MDFIHLAAEIEERYRRYLRTTFYIHDQEVTCAGMPPMHSVIDFRENLCCVMKCVRGRRKILLTNFSMLEYQLLRPKDSPLFDETHGRNWTFLVLDEAHQYRGTRGAEMSLLLRRLKQRLRENGNRQSFRCIATSASLAGGASDREAVATFAANLFDEPFAAEDVILAQTEKITQKSGRRLAVQAYSQIRKAIDTDDPIHLREFEATSDARHDLESFSVRERAGLLLAQDARIGLLHDTVSDGPREAIEIAGALFPDTAPDKRIGALSALSDALNRAERPHSGGVFLSVRYHSFQRALEGAFVRYVPERANSLTPQGGSDENGFSFELALCRECGQHYLVGRQLNGFLAEAVRDPSRDEFGVSFFRPVNPSEDEEDEDAVTRRRCFMLCVHCAALWPLGKPPRCDHKTCIVIEEQPRSNEKADQMRQCATCGYSGNDPVREIIHGGDGPHAVIATSHGSRKGSRP